jgi:hypothetical protein
MTYTVLTFSNRLLRKILKIFWPNIISNEELWGHAQRKPVAVQIKLWKWKWIRHTLRKDSSATEEQALSWNTPPKDNVEEEDQGNAAGESNRGGNRNNGKDLDRGQGNSWKQGPLVLLHGGPMFQSQVTGIDLILYNTNWITRVQFLAGYFGIYQSTFCP